MNHPLLRDRFDQETFEDVGGYLRDLHEVFQTLPAAPAAPQYTPNRIRLPLPQNAPISILIERLEHDILHLESFVFNLPSNLVRVEYLAKLRLLQEFRHTLVIVQEYVHD